jgi:hypothetical protein
MRVEFVSDRMTYILLSGCWFHIIVLDFHAPRGDKIDNVKDSFYEELERDGPQCPLYAGVMRILLALVWKAFLRWM